MARSSTSQPRMTGPTVAVLEQFLAAPDDDHYGLVLGASCALASGTIHPILARLEDVGWLASGWEAVDPAEAGRPRRRYYRLTATGREHAAAAVRAVHAERARRRARLAPATGGAG